MESQRNRDFFGTQGARLSTQKRFWCTVFFGLVIWVLAYQAWHLAQRRGLIAAVAKDPRPSIGALDTPYAEIDVKGHVTLRGWALHPAGVADARVYVDDIYLSLLEINAPRADVRSAYPALPATLYSGFFAYVPLPMPLRPAYTVRVEIKLHNGRTSTLGPWRLAP
jgi:hypothetical protein